MYETLPFLSAMAFVAGLIDSAVGGGGLIQIPALFNALPSEAPATLFGTNKFASIFGTATAARSYMRRITLSWSLVLPATVCAFALSFAGAAVVSHVPKTVMKPAVLVMLIAMAGYTLCFFVPSGNILIEYAVPMAVCNIAGSLVGTHLAMKGGAQFVRVLFLMLLCVLIGKFAYDLI